MKTFRVSIAGLMAVVLLVSVGLAALRNPTILWASSLFTCTVALLCTAVLGAIAARGRSQVTWAGLAVFGWAYLGIAFGLGSEGNGATPPPFLTQALADYMKASFDAARWPVQSDTPPHGQRIIEPPVMALVGGGFGRPVVTGTTLASVNWINLRRIVHSLGAIAFALLGGLVARFFAARNVGTEGPIHGERSSPSG